MPTGLRKIVVSPEVNPPDPFPGFGGFCGWPRICRLRDGTLFVAFSAGYWHASWVNPRPELPDHAEYMESQFEGGGAWEAPTGGRILWTRSRDDGATWSRPAGAGRPARRLRPPAPSSSTATAPCTWPP